MDLSKARKQRRVLVVEFNDLFVGLLVDEVVGMQHFAQDALLTGATSGVPFIQGQFDSDQLWQVFSPFALAQAPGFMDVAA